MLLKPRFEVTQSIFLQSCWEWHTQWSQRSRPVVLKWLTVSVRQAAHYDVSIRQAARAAFVTSNCKIFLTQTFPRCGATCFILPSKAMTQVFNGVNFVYRSVEVYLTFCRYLRVLVRIRNFYNGGRY